ncbi:WD40-repeat-containing domain protein [Suillus clintonianus]|uniref:WD40-repeat-containing domain protein n=1 Tax=Suillus clintonianus TaxID=1904413 RepID=UPI001B869C73|nr:WD40-repeat-containing domain protein [Suillus clintonianus]KAG2111742.1 WD40-repeat-containing domain protein [Suillus clintonianus]
MTTIPPTSSPRSCSTPQTCIKKPQITKSLPAFEDYKEGVNSLAVLPDGRRMVSCSKDRTLRLWDLNTGDVMKKMEGHYDKVRSLAVSRDGKLIASGDKRGEFIAWEGESGESLTEAIKAHFYAISTLDFSPNGAVLATASSSSDEVKLWSTETWQFHGLIVCSGQYRDITHCVRYSPSGEHLAIATTKNVEIYNPATRQCVAKFKGHKNENLALAWMPDGTRLLSGGCYNDPNIREWDPLTWQQVGDPWTDDTYMKCVPTIAIHPTGTLIAFASVGGHVGLWRISDRRTIMIAVSNSDPGCTLQRVTFSTDGRRILGCGWLDEIISEWAVPEDALAEDAPNEQPLRYLISRKNALPKDIPDDNATKNASQHQIIPQCFEILVMNPRARNACIFGDLPTAERSLTQEINTDSKNYVSYANRSFVMARKLDWDQALHDATASVSIKPSLIGHICKGLALCGKQQLWDAMKAFDLAFTFTDGDSKKAHFLFLIKSFALFNANQDKEGVIPVQELAIRPNPDPLACRVVEAYMRVQLGIVAVNGARHHEAAGHFTAAVKAGAFFSKLDIHSQYEDFVVLFGWDLKSLWQIANQQRCHALLRTARFGAALESYRHMMDMSDESTKAIFLAWTSDLDEFE